MEAARRKPDGVSDMSAWEKEDSVSKRSKVLSDANNLIHGDRQNDYGKPELNFARIAKCWSVVVDVEIKPYQVALMMAQLKLARLSHKEAALNMSGFEDGCIDAAGYAALALELASNSKSS